MKQKMLTLLLCAGLVTLPFLTGCGIKPDHVDPPQGVEKDTFPNTYPDPSTDPRP